MSDNNWAGIIFTQRTITVVLFISLFFFLLLWVISDVGGKEFPQQEHYNSTVLGLYKLAHW